jgi:hypothetical protein
VSHGEGTADVCVSSVGSAAVSSADVECQSVTAVHCPIDFRSFIQSLLTDAERKCEELAGGCR